MAYISHTLVEYEDGRLFQVTLYDDGAYINNKRSRLKRGSPLFKAVLRTLHENSDPGSLTRERLARCADTADLS